MFTGIIEAIGTIRALTPCAATSACWSKPASSIWATSLGDSIAVNGVCLTAVELPVTASGRRQPRNSGAHRLHRSLQGRQPGQLEKALTPPAASAVIWSAAMSMCRAGRGAGR